MSTVGRFRINVAIGGHPIWSELFIDGRPVGTFNSLELRDIGYAVEKARIEARRIARSGMDPDRVEDY